VAPTRVELARNARPMGRFRRTADGRWRDAEGRLRQRKAAVHFDAGTLPAGRSLR
jgi:hypothetical protein